MSRTPAIYASTAVVRRAIAAVGTLGSGVSRVIYRPDGSFEFVLSANDDDSSEFDRLESAGLL
jgi:hypothetical protein